MSELSGLRVAAFEGRRAEELARLIEARGGVALAAPATEAEPLEPGPDMVELAQRLREGELDAMLFLTASGVTLLPQVMAPIMGPNELVRRLGEVTLGARGTRTAEALAELGLGEVLVSEPREWLAMVETFDRAHPVAGRVVAFQESGTGHAPMRAELMDRGAEVLQVAVYRWRLPRDLSGLIEAIEGLAEGSIRVALFTNATQIDHVMAVAAELDVDEPLRDALRAGVVGALGPHTVARLAAYGIRANVIPERRTLDALVSDTARRAREILESR